MNCGTKCMARNWQCRWQQRCWLVVTLWVARRVAGTRTLAVNAERSRRHATISDSGRTSSVRYWGSGAQEHITCIGCTQAHGTSVNSRAAVWRGRIHMHRDSCVLGAAVITVPENILVTVQFFACSKKLWMLCIIQLKWNYTKAQYIYFKSASENQLLSKFSANNWWIKSIMSCGEWSCPKF